MQLLKNVHTDIHTPHTPHTHTHTHTHARTHTHTDRKIETHNLFLREPDGGEEVHRFLKAKVNVNAKEEDEEEFAHIFLLLVAIKLLI